MIREPHPHPAKAAGCTKAQVDAFERVCIGLDESLHPKTADALVSKGLIVRTMVTVGCDALGQIEVPCYHVPTPICFAWCKWCEDQPDETGLMAEPD